jgi:hypothetical protein
MSWLRPLPDRESRGWRIAITETPEPIAGAAATVSDCFYHDVLGRNTEAFVRTASHDARHGCWSAELINGREARHRRC